MAQDQDLRLTGGDAAEPCSEPARDDHDLLAAWVGRRDAGALQALLDRHRPVAVRVSQRILRDPAGAEDAAQEACIALAGLDAMVDGDISAWIRGCAAKAALQQRRARLRRRRREMHTAPPVEAAVGDLLVLVDECVDLLPEQDRRLIGDYFYLERTQAEIAAAAGISQVAVHKRLRIALDRLQGLMRRRGVRLGALALLAVLMGGTAAAARATARRIGWGGSRLATGVAVAAIAAIACVGLAVAWPAAPAPAPMTTPAPAGSPGRHEIAGADFVADWAVVVGGAPASTPGTGTSASKAFASVSYGWNDRAAIVRDGDGDVLRLEADPELHLGIRAVRCAPAGAPYAFHLEFLQRTDGIWQRMVHRSALVRRDGIHELYVSIQCFDVDGRLLGTVSRVAFPRSADNRGPVYVATRGTEIRPPRLRLMDWNEVLGLVAGIDRQVDPASFSPVTISAGEETLTGD